MKAMLFRCPVNRPVSYADLVLLAYPLGFIFIYSLSSFEVGFRHGAFNPIVNTIISDFNPMNPTIEMYNRYTTYRYLIPLYIFVTISISILWERLAKHKYYFAVISLFILMMFLSSLSPLLKGFKCEDLFRCIDFSGEFIPLSAKTDPEILGYKGEKVKISGNIVFKDYFRDSIVIAAVAAARPGKNINEIVVNKPSQYLLEVPRNAGDINLRAINIDYKYNIVHHGVCNDNPIHVAEYDMAGKDIYFKNGGRPFLMQNYFGPTVRLSGKITCNDYKKGWIAINIWQGSKLKRCQIAYKELQKPGIYVIEVPKNAGEIYIEAYNVTDFLKDDYEGFSKGDYLISPLLVTDKNLKDIDILIK